MTEVSHDDSISIRESSITKIEMNLFSSHEYIRMISGADAIYDKILRTDLLHPVNDHGIYEILNNLTSMIRSNAALDENGESTRRFIIRAGYRICRSIIIEISANCGPRDITI